ncbi:hypothetical protein NE683_12220 [Bariatricus massiliensis]|uniref:Uncharacterized protein n=1 Tax=Bariatricus massiliensis TaxID=1745713 RepID=A0ABS8DIV9_9FIRM|nr:hypothetical protein [Bariatricus massiliensis]MCB7306161.1 hypothetical protein [Bariatricus massiliensis]MCB7375239.1 hypothetical protein [Bariatricus massiliensis]MCB7387699.1 hypothetical protein [Bariatricus massiliensis]MCB7411860.1 hypothetical protein [Bariatricus massiliensis]MCQ5253996.1 hypothetical protein [Bariatricus massiliensis]
MEELESVVNMFIEKLTEEMKETQSSIDWYKGKFEEQKRCMSRFLCLKDDIDSLKEN